MKKLALILSSFAPLLFAAPVSAHEQYVLTKQQLANGFADTNYHVLDALRSSENLKICLLVCIAVTTVSVLYFFFQYSKLGLAFGRFLLRLDNIGHLLLRFALAGSLLASAYFHAFLGPEIPAGSIGVPASFSGMLVILFYAVGILMLLGLFTRITGMLFLILLLFTLTVYGQYTLTYFNYFGEAIALIIFGSYFVSLDKTFFGVKKFVVKYRDLELFIIRTTYGLSVMYPAITIKLLHPDIIVMIVNEYHLNQIHWLFPSDPLLISLGTGLAQILVGLMIIIGFETRLASFVTFFLYLLSVLFFKEAVWPHYILLALACYLVLNNGGRWTFDHWIGKKLRKNV